MDEQDTKKFEIGISSGSELHMGEQSTQKLEIKPQLFTCGICGKEKPAREKATLVYTDTGEELGPGMCGKCMYQGILWAAAHANRVIPIVIEDSDG